MSDTDVFTVSRNIVASTTYSNVNDDVVAADPTSPEADSQKYDLWRILSRGAIPSGVLSSYEPTIVTQRGPTGTISGTVSPASTPSVPVYVYAGGITGQVTTTGIFSISGVPVGS
jgi:hypothetical protein